MNLRNNYPHFIRTDRQISYFHNIYDMLKRNGQEVQEQDCYALGVLSLNCDLIDIANNDIAKNGSVTTFTTERGETQRINPMIQVLKEAQLQCKHYFKSFGMTPADRASDLLAVSASNEDAAVFDKV